MRKSRYDSFAEWKTDMDKVNLKPNDKHLLQHVIRCVENSSPQIKLEVTDYLVGLSLETNPWTVFKQAVKEHPNHRLVVKTKNDPWFEI